MSAAPTHGPCSNPRHARENILFDPAASAKRLGMTPLRRIGEPWEMAAAALFLAGPGAGFITGQVLAIDGGTLITDGS